MIKHIIFDVGRVLVGYNPKKILDMITPETPHRELYMTELFEHEIWQHMDRGDVSHEQAISRFQSHHHDEVRQLLSDFAYHLDITEGTKSLFIELEKKYPIYILSNFQADPFDKLVDTHPFMKNATGTVVSAKVNMMKPEKEIYHYLLETHSLKAENCLFIDDLSENIQACKVVGMHGIVFESPEQLERELIKFGVQARQARQSFK